MSKNNDVYLTIDIGGTFLKSIVINEDGETFPGSGFKILSNSDKSKEEVTQSIRECIFHSLNFIQSINKNLKKIGIAIPGPFDYKKGIFLMEHKFKFMYGENLKQLIYDILGSDQKMPIYCIHDANAVLFGEQWKGGAKDYRNSAIATLGTGIGFAHSQDRIVQCAELGSPLITIFKRPYKDGILEDYVSQRGFLKIYEELINDPISPETTVSDIGRQADNGDTISIETFNIVGEALSESLSGILEEKQIECLLLGGQISCSYKHMEKSIKQGLAGVKCLKRISPVESIEYAAFYGILWILLNKEN